VDPARAFHADGVVVKSLSDTLLCFKTCVIMRADNTSRLVDEYPSAKSRRWAQQKLLACGGHVRVLKNHG
jgi:hypothetical protein